MKIVNYLKDNKKFNTEELLNFCAKELNISDDVSITLSQNKSLLEKLSKDIKLEALLYKALSKQYVLYTKDSLANKTIICHEMIHLEQQERGDLSFNKDFTKITWKGDIFDNSLEYDKRPWEKEAYTKQNKLIRKFNKQLRNKTNVI